MAYIPEGARWFIADVVEAIEVAGHSQVRIHINTRLVRADSPEEAYEKALQLGREGLGARGQRRYKNPDGETVTIRFLGLADLNVIHDELEHGAELTYRERRTRSLERARRFVTPKSEMAVFAPRTPATGPNFMSADIAEELERRFGTIDGLRRAKKPTRKRKKGAA